jgi:hypothetical protein
MFVILLYVESRGQIRAGWSAATDATAPIRYEVYIQASTATGLFSTANIIAVTPNLQYDIFTLPDGSFLVNGTTYYVGVRAIDGVNNRDSNTVSMNVISTGVLTAIDVYECNATFSINESNNFYLTMWANKNDSLAISPDAVLGTASYQVYDKAGSAIVGMSGSGITANAQGLFIAAPITNLMDPDRKNDHYDIKVTIIVDGEARTNFVGISDEVQHFALNGVSSLNTSNNLVGSFWVEENGKVKTTGLGTGSYLVYDVNGTLIPGISETGIVADSNGFFVVTPVPLPVYIDPSQAHIVQVSCTVQGTIRTHNIVIDANPTQYTNRATFSISASNMLEATFWSTRNDVLTDPAILTVASYQVYDKSGVAVAGLSETGITPDVQGLFHTTPVSAILLADLTHYSVKITINVAGQDRVTVKGISLLGT